MGARRAHLSQLSHRFLQLLDLGVLLGDDGLALLLLLSIHLGLEFLKLRLVAPTNLLHLEIQDLRL